MEEAGLQEAGLQEAADGPGGVVVWQPEAEEGVPSSLVETAGIQETAGIHLLLSICQSSRCTLRTTVNLAIGTAKAGEVNPSPHRQEN